MDTQALKQLVSEGYKLFQQGNIAQLLDRYHDDAEWLGPDSDYVPYAGNYHGKQGIAEFFKTLDQTAECTEFEPLQMIAEGDTVVVTGKSRWTARSTGSSWDNPFVHLFTIRDNKVARFQAFWDTSPAEHALHPGAAAQTSAKPLHH